MISVYQPTHQPIYSSIHPHNTHLAANFVNAIAAPRRDIKGCEDLFRTIGACQPSWRCLAHRFFLIRGP